MSWEGTGAPVLIVDGVAHAFPRCRQGGRKESWPKEVDETRKTILGEIVRGRKMFRFKAEYSWGMLTNEQMANLVQWDNEGRDILVQPYSDTATLRIPCRIVEVLPEKGAHVERQDVVTLKVEALSLVESRPIPDRRLLGFGSKPKKGVVG